MLADMGGIDPRTCVLQKLVKDTGQRLSWSFLVRSPRGGWVQMGTNDPTAAAVG